MGIYRVFSTKDNTITNAFKLDLRTRATQSNMGASDILEVFSIYGAQSSDSLEKSRILIDFPIHEIRSAILAGEIPSNSNDRSFKLKLYNAQHNTTVPEDFTIAIHPLQKIWSEGSGLDMEGYTDLGSSNWASASFNSPWTTEGADYKIDVPQHNHTCTFLKGTENLEVDVSYTVEEWLSELETPGTGMVPNGFLLKMTDSEEDGSSLKSYYTKRFFGKGTQFFFKSPVLEAQFDSSTQDSSALPEGYSQADKYILNISNLKSSYKTYETVKLKVHSRNKTWQPNIYTKASAAAPLDLIDDMYYKVVRVADNLEAISYSTGSGKAFSKVSYDANGSFFDLKMSNLEPNYMYEISFIRKDGTKYIEIEDRFKFRLEK